MAGDKHSQSFMPAPEQPIVGAEDELMEAIANDDPSVPLDVHLFLESRAEGNAVMCERRKMYGSHIENDRRFPKEHEAGLYLKCARLIRMIERGEEPDDDTLMDLSVYCDLKRSARRAT